MDLLRFTLLVLALMWLGWFLMGGPESGRVRNAFLKPPAPLNTGETYGPGISIGGVQGETKEPAEVPGTEPKSLFVDAVSIYVGNARAGNPQEEYIEIAASGSNTQPVNITGWKLKSATSENEAVIGTGVYLPFGETVNKEDKIFLNPGDRAIIATGESPRGISFRTNTCTGYFEQFQDFYPTLPKECPYQSDEVRARAETKTLGDACLDYLDTLPRCEAHVKAAPIGVSSACNDYINERIHYRGCLEVHKNDTSFYKKEWRIFLGKKEELWKERRETIKLLDTEGRIVTSVSY